MNKRHCGILLPIPSLPSKYGIGDLGSFAYAFVDFLAAAGQKYWQILPINPTDGINGHSPYSCFSAFAGNPLFISPQLMIKEGFARTSDLRGVSAFNGEAVDYAKVTVFKEKFFEAAYRRFSKSTDYGNFEDFTKRNSYWLEDFALFAAIKSSLGGRCWKEWPKALKTRQPKALRQFARRNAKAIGRIQWIQYLFFRQWHSLKAYANSKGVAVIGDIPIYVTYDSVEVWCHPSFFKVDGAGNLKFISGCPPDYFSRTGQRWGNPVYDWANLKKDGYSWWVHRVAHNLQLFDCLRIDHFRGFASFWQIPVHERLAVFGRWVKGPGEDFLKVLAKRFKPLPIIAEDLGEITPDVVSLMKKFNFPSMRVLLFAFGSDPKTNPHVPAKYPAHCVAYTGTHDNNTVQGWYQKEAKPHELANIERVLKRKIRPKHLHWAMIDVLMKSKANTVIIPMADFLGLAEGARMNTPATKVNNWKWRLKANAWTPALSQKILQITKRSKRG